MNLLVTGGAGYIGSVVSQRLIEEGHTVTVLDDLSKGHRDAVPDGARFVRGRIHDAAVVCAGARFDAVIHLAASSIVEESVRHPDLYVDNNVTGTALLCDAMRELGATRIVVSSSAAVYGEPDSPTVSETSAEVPVNPYGSSKLAVDRNLTARAKSDGIAAISLRYFNVAGAYGRFGERHDPETHLIPLALAAALGERELVVHGDDYPTPDGTCIRDYVHVTDIADAHVLALDALDPGQHQILNLGNGAGFSVREVLEAVHEVAGRPLRLSVGSRRSGDPAVLVAAAGRAHRVLGWSPKRPELTTIVADAWRFATQSGR